jgi:hypothetical protein
MGRLSNSVWSQWVFSETHKQVRCCFVSTKTCLTAFWDLRSRGTLKYARTLLKETELKFVQHVLLFTWR